LLQEATAGTARWHCRKVRRNCGAVPRFCGDGEKVR
jgi:hypothetical protein